MYKFLVERNGKGQRTAAQNQMKWRDVQYVKAKNRCRLEGVRDVVPMGLSIHAWHLGSWHRICT